MKGRSHENDVFTPCGRSVHTGEKNGWTDGTARFHVHTHQGSQILHSFSWRFRKYKFHVTVMVAVTSFEVWVRIMGFREATTCRALCEGHCGGPCWSGECMSVGPTPTAREDNALRSGNGRGRKGRGEDKTQDRRHAVTTKTLVRSDRRSPQMNAGTSWVKPPRAVGSDG